MPIPYASLIKGPSSSCGSCIDQIQLFLGTIPSIPPLLSLDLQLLTQDSGPDSCLTSSLPSTEGRSFFCMPHFLSWFGPVGLQRDILVLSVFNPAKIGTYDLQSSIGFLRCRQLVCYSNQPSHSALTLHYILRMCLTKVRDLQLRFTFNYLQVYRLSSKSNIPRCRPSFLMISLSKLLIM